MSMILEAPFAGPITVMIVPNPEPENTEGRDISVELKLSIDGTRSSYVKSSERRTLIFTWRGLGRGKLVEIEEFFKLYVGDHIRLTDFRGDQWDVIFGENPIDVSINTRSVNAGAARKESGSVTLEFLGIKI